MRIRATLPNSRVSLALGALCAVATFGFAACGPAPVVVTDADQALLTRPTTSASAVGSAATVSTVPPKKDPLLVPDEKIVDLPPFSCTQGKQLDLLGQTFCLLLEPRDWHDGEAQCQKIGAHLATMKNSSLPNALREVIVSPTNVDRFWIGLAEPNEGRWIWSNGTPMRFSAFGPGEPNNAGRGEDCGEWIVATGRWNDVDCFQPRPFMCEAPTPPAGSRAKGLTCHGQKFTFGKNDYCLEGAATWESAQKACLRNGGELVMLDTDAENAVLRERLGPKIPVTNVWIGLSDAAIEGQFRWISGDSLEVNIWHAGEPNDFQGAEDCVEWVAADGRWNDRPCTDPLPLLCEKPHPDVTK